MRRVVDEAAQRGLRREIIYCSSDPGSLDGALFPTIGAAVYDGTAPHTIELAFPGARRQLCDAPALPGCQGFARKNSQFCVRQMGNWAAIIQQVFRLTAAAGKLRENLRHVEPWGFGPFDQTGPGHHRPGIAPRCEEPGREKKRFLSGITPRRSVVLLRFGGSVGQKSLQLAGSLWLCFRIAGTHLQSGFRARPRGLCLLSPAPP